MQSRSSALPFKQALAQIFHTAIEQKGGRGVGKLVNIDCYADTLHRPPFDRL